MDQPPSFHLLQGVRGNGADSVVEIDRVVRFRRVCESLFSGRETRKFGRHGARRVRQGLSVDAAGELVLGPEPTEFGEGVGSFSLSWRRWSVRTNGGRGVEIVGVAAGLREIGGSHRRRARCLLRLREIRARAGSDFEGNGWFPRRWRSAVRRPVGRGGRRIPSDEGVGRSSHFAFGNSSNVEIHFSGSGVGIGIVFLRVAAGGAGGDPGAGREHDFEKGFDAVLEVVAEVG